MGNPTQITSLRIPTETLAAAKTLKESDSGKTFFLNLAGGFTVTLPPVAKAGNGFHVKFVVKTSPTTAYIISEDTSVDTDVINTIMTSSEDAGGNGDYDTTHTQINLVASASVIGDWVEIISDGVLFYAHGNTNVQAGATST